MFVYFFIIFHLIFTHNFHWDDLIRFSHFIHSIVMFTMNVCASTSSKIASSLACTIDGIFALLSMCMFVCLRWKMLNAYVFVCVRVRKYSRIELFESYKIECISNFFANSLELIMWPFKLTMTVFLRMLKSSRVNTDVALVNAPHVSILMLQWFVTNKHVWYLMLNSTRNK